MDANVFGKFHVLARLASGGISDIFKAKTTGVAGFEKVQVLKRIHSELSSDQRFISAFARETQVAVSLNHRNIVQVYEFGRVGPDYFLAMEYVDGVDLGRILKMRDRGAGPIPQGIALHIASEVAAGLDYAHSKSDYGGGSLGVVHGDLAPNHVLLSFEGSVKILDFGIARAALERDGYSAGRPGHQSPEQARGEMIEPRSDVYSLGILLYEMILGSSPFAGRDEAEILENNREGRYIPPHEVQPDIDSQVLEMLKRSLSANADERYAHARDFVRAALQVQRAAGEFHNTRTLRDYLAEYVGERGERVPQDLRPVDTSSGEIGGGDGDQDRFEIDTFIPDVEQPPMPDPELASEPVLTEDFESVTSRQRPLKGGPLRQPDPPRSSPRVEAPRRAGPTSVRKPVVVVHLDAAGMAKIGPLVDTTGTTATEVRRDLRNLIEGMAYKAGGVTTPDGGADSFTVMFGVPTATENDHEVAVRMALDAVEATTGMGRDLLARAGLAAGPTPITLRAGIKAGTVRMSGSGDDARYALLGDAAEVASALANKCPAGGVLATGATVQLTRDGFVYRKGAEVRGRGGKTNQGHQVVGTRTHAERRRALNAAGHTLVGREEELAHLETSFRRVADEGVVGGIILTGPPGMGKSRLLIEMAKRLGDEAAVLQGACRFYSAGSPYALWVDIVRDHLGINEYDDPLRVRQRLDAWLARVFESSADSDLARSAILEMLALRRRGDSATSLDGDTEDRQSASFRAVQLLLDRVSPEKVLVLLVEDAQWIDATSAELLRRVLEKLQRPMFVACTARPGDLPRPLGEMPRMEIGPLSNDSQRALVRRRLGSVPDAVVAEIIRKAGGNPFFLIELAEAFQESSEGGAFEIPVTVRGAVTARVDLLSPAAGRVLRAAAVIGRSAPLSLVEAVAAAEPEHAAEETPAALAELASKGLLVEETGGHGESLWVFRQTIVQEIVYDSLEGRQRRDVHHEVAERLQQLRHKGDAGQAAELGRHLEAAGEVERAGLAYLEAADEAARAYANSEALAFYERAYRHLASDPTREMEILAGRERVHSVTGNSEGQAKDLAKLERIARAREDFHWLSEALVRRSEQARQQGRYDEARRSAIAAVEAAVRTGDPAQEGRAEKEMGEIYAYGGDIEGALERYSRALKFFARGGTPRQHFRTHSAMGNALLMASRHGEADEHFQKATALAEEVGDDWGAASNLQARGAIAYINADFETCLELSGQALDMARQIGAIRAEGTNTNNIGLTYGELGMWDIAEEWLLRALEIYESLEERVYVVDTLIGLGLVERRLGRRGPARKHLQRALDVATDLGHVYWMVNADLALALHDLEGSTAADWRRALRLATRAAGLARESSLAHGVILGDSRAAAALLKLEELEQAKERSTRAISTLEQHRVVECSEEEVLFTHYRVLYAAGDATAGTFLNRALEGIQAKSDRVRDQERRQAFLAVPLHTEVIGAARSR